MRGAVTRRSSTFAAPIRAAYLGCLILAAGCRPYEVPDRVSVVEEAHRPLIGAPEAFERPVFQRFWVSPAGPVTEAGDSRDPRRVRELDRAVERTLGAGWSVQQIAGSGAYEILPERGVAESSIRMGTVWDEAYALRDVPGIEHASPHFIVERESGEQPGGEVCPSCRRSRV